MIDLRIVKGFTKVKREEDPKARPPNSFYVHHHLYSKCEGCRKDVRHVSHFAGHWVCRRCQYRRNMPLVGYTSKEKWKTEQRLLRKRNPFLSWEDSKVLWREYMERGLSEREAKIRINSLKGRIVKSYNHWITSQREEPNKVEKIEFKLPQ